MENRLAGHTVERSAAIDILRGVAVARHSGLPSSAILWPARTHALSDANRDWSRAAARADCDRSVECRRIVMPVRRSLGEPDRVLAAVVAARWFRPRRMAMALRNLYAYPTFGETNGRAMIKAALHGAAFIRATLKAGA